jgi:hypothetical protein
MIQTKQPILYYTRSQKVGVVTIKITEQFSDGVGGTRYVVCDYADGIEINRKAIDYSREKINQTDAYIEANYADMLDGLSRTDRDDVKLKIGLMLDTTMNRCDNDKTIYGLIPNDWELTE